MVRAKPQRWSVFGSASISPGTNPDCFPKSKLMQCDREGHDAVWAYIILGQAETLEHGFNRRCTQSTDRRPRMARHAAFGWVGQRNVKSQCTGRWGSLAARSQAQGPAILVWLCRTTSNACVRASASVSVPTGACCCVCELSQSCDGRVCCLRAARLASCCMRRV
jgi:hypothetical protein